MSVSVNGFFFFANKLRKARERERVVDKKYILIGADEKLIRKLLRIHLPRRRREWDPCWLQFPRRMAHIFPLAAVHPRHPLTYPCLRLDAILFKLTSRNTGSKTDSSRLAAAAERERERGREQKGRRKNRCK
ncbi:hypothetical protein E3U43_021792, partial [Larimichthys crocea]